MFNASMNFNLGEEIEAIRDTVRRFAIEEIAPRADEIDKTNSFPNDLWEKMGALGLHGITVSETAGRKWAIWPIVLLLRKTAGQAHRLA